MAFTRREILKITAAAPLLPLLSQVWDDHEAADDSFLDGANNHTEGVEGTWAERLQVARRVYSEWMPIRRQRLPLMSCCAQPRDGGALGLGLQAGRLHCEVE